MKKKVLKAIGKLLFKLVIAGAAFFVITFTVYMFNLDMKATAMLAPFLEKWYDKMPHNQYI